MRDFISCGMSTSKSSSTDWPWRDLKKIAKVIITPLSEYALAPTKSNTSDLGLELYSPYTYTVDHFRTIQIRLDLTIKLPVGVTGRILPYIESPFIQVYAETIPSNFEEVIKISVKNTIDKKVNVNRGCKIARLVPQTFYQPDIYLKPFEPGTCVVPPPPYGHQHVMTMSQLEGTPQMGSQSQTLQSVPSMTKVQEETDLLSTQQPPALMSGLSHAAVLNQQEGVIHHTAATQPCDSGTVMVVNLLSHLQQ